MTNILRFDVLTRDKIEGKDNSKHGKSFVNASKQINKQKMEKR